MKSGHASPPPFLTGACLLPQSIGLVHQGDEAGLIHPLGEGGDKVGAHVQADVRPHQVREAEGPHGHAKAAGDGLYILGGMLDSFVHSLCSFFIFISHRIWEGETRGR